jgi:hypothetical protein
MGQGTTRLIALQGRANCRAAGRPVFVSEHRCAPIRLPRLALLPFRSRHVRMRGHRSLQPVPGQLLLLRREATAERRAGQAEATVAESAASAVAMKFAQCGPCARQQRAERRRGPDRTVRESGLAANSRNLLWVALATLRNSLRLRFATFFAQWANGGK